ncbi:hypothetical protein [Ferrimicrobium sp.]|uniref:hypothetical protein n=1 Tax=Ferrimicrobium sp. TaxID=2926050 RepID=UPI0026209F1C|nr:hypothetical protein [Ferrimicrobium sp.]
MREVVVDMVVQEVDDMPGDLALDHLGLGPFPASMMVFPRRLGPLAAAALAAGRTPDSEGEPRFLGYVLDGEIDRAKEELCLYPDQAWARYNLGVLSGEFDQDQDKDPVLSILEHLALFILGRSDNLDPVLEKLDGEVPTAVRVYAGMVMLALASEQGKPEVVGVGLSLLSGLLEVVDPLPAAMIKRAILPFRNQLNLTPAEVATGYREVVSTLRGTDLLEDLGGAWLELAGVLHEMGRENPGYLREAVQCYQESTKIFSRTSAPAMFASIQIDIAVCYLAMPMLESSDAVRFAVAISGLREAMEILTKESYPREWYAGRLNLANALVYAPSAHVEANLVEAITIYSSLVGEVDSGQDPLGYARLMFNWGNALAHLGDFVEARSRLHEARRIFEEFECYDEVREVRGILDSVERHHARGVVDGAL